MSVPYRHILHQGPVLASLAKTAGMALKQRLGVPSTGAQLGVDIERTVPARSPDLIRDYVRAVGGDPSAYRKTVPAHLFPQWGFGLAAETLAGVPYPMMKVLNGGCRLEMNAPLPQGEPLNVRARLEGIDDNGRRAVLHQIVTTGTASSPDAVVAHLYAIVPLGGGDKGGKAPAQKAKRERPRVPHEAREVADWRLSADAGLQFAALTGDFNPVHWVRPYAKAFGFRNTILHGFATMARAIEGIHRRRYSGAVDRLAVVDVKFVKPLVLPARVRLFTAGNSIFVGDAVGGPAYLSGSVAPRKDNA